jgi:hypothetical protein
MRYPRYPTVNQVPAEPWATMFSGDTNPEKGKSA